MWLTRLRAVERTQHTNASFTIAAVVGNRLVPMFQTTKRVRVLENAGDEIRVVERVGGSNRRPAVRRRTVRTQRLAAVQATDGSRRRRHLGLCLAGKYRSVADVAGAGGQRMRQRATSSHGPVDQVVVGQLAHAAERHLRFLATERTRELSYKVEKSSSS